MSIKLNQVIQFQNEKINEYEYVENNESYVCFLRKDIAEILGISLYNFSIQTTNYKMPEKRVFIRTNVDGGRNIDKTFLTPEGIDEALSKMRKKNNKTKEFREWLNDRYLTYKIS